MNKYCRTDLACEASNDLASIEGTEYFIKDHDVCILEKLDILTPEASKALNKKAGRYVTVSTPRLQYLDEEELERISDVIVKELLSMICNAANIASLSADFSIFVAGLGNSKIISDAIGPETVERISVTRHIKDKSLNLFNQLKMCTVSALSPSVMGKTGIESSEIIKATIEKISPDIIIIIDALAARSVDRLARTVQISNTGITPGAGIGNFRSELSRQTVGIPVISIGIPTVVDSSVLAFDMLSASGISSIPQSITDRLDSMDNFFVTPKEIDVIIEKSAILLSKALDKVFVINS